MRVRGSVLILALGWAGVLTNLAAAAAPVDAAVSAGIVNRDPYPARQVSSPGGVTGLPDLTYTGVQGYRPLKLDLYLPPAATRKASLDALQRTFDFIDATIGDK